MILYPLSTFLFYHFSPLNSPPSPKIVPDIIFIYHSRIKTKIQCKYRVGHLLCPILLSFISNVFFSFFYHRLPSTMSIFSLSSLQIKVLPFSLLSYHPQPCPPFSARTDPLTRIPCQDPWWIVSTRASHQVCIQCKYFDHCMFEDLQRRCIVA